MKPPSPVRLGLAPLGKFVFSHEAAVVEKRKLQDRLRSMGVDFVDLDDVFPETDGLVESDRQVPAAVASLKAQQVDALLLPHCNFGTESAAGLLAREMAVPTLLWGPRDEGPGEDGTRLRDSLCGLLASSKVVGKLVGQKFSYLPNCDVDDQQFETGMRTFIRASRVVRDVRNLKIGLLGARIRFFWTTIVDESDLLTRFGIQVVPYEIESFLDRSRRLVASDRDSLESQLQQCEGDWLDTAGCDRDELLLGVAAARVLLEDAERDGIDVWAIQIFDTISAALGCGAGIYMEIVGEQVPIALESDVHGAVSLAILQAARMTDDPVFFPEFVVRNPENDNSVCMWHIGAPPSLRHDSNEKVPLRAPWILPGTKPSQAQMRLRDGDLVVCRFDGEGGSYRIGFGEGTIHEGPATRDYYGWLQVGDWPLWERQLVMGPYIHHVAAAYGPDVTAVVEAARYLDIPVERFGDPNDPFLAGIPTLA